MYNLYLNWTINAKLLKNKTSAIKEICSWLPSWLDGWKFWLETWQPRTGLFGRNAAAGRYLRLTRCRLRCDCAYSAASSRGRRPPRRRYWTRSTGATCWRRCRPGGWLSGSVASACSGWWCWRRRSAPCSYRSPRARTCSSCCRSASSPASDRYVAPISPHLGSPHLLLHPPPLEEVRSTAISMSIASRSHRREWALLSFHSVCLSVGHSATYSLPRLIDHNEIWSAGIWGPVLGPV